LSAALLVLTFLVVLVFLPETRYSRSLALASGDVVADLVTAETVDNDKDLSPALPLPPTHATEEAGATIKLVGTGAPTSNQRWSVTNGRDPLYRPIDATLRVFVTATIGPAWIPVGWFAAVKGIAVGQSFIAAQIWQAEPYFFSNSAVGMTYIPSVCRFFVIT
jgi:hypothetical protein